MAEWRSGRSMQKAPSLLKSFSAVRSGLAHVVAPATCCPVTICSPTAAFGLSKDTARGKPVREGGAKKAPGPFVGTARRRPLFLSVEVPCRGQSVQPFGCREQYARLD